MTYVTTLGVALGGGIVYGAHRTSVTCPAVNLGIPMKDIFLMTNSMKEIEEIAEGTEALRALLEGNVKQWNDYRREMGKSKRRLPKHLTDLSNQDLSGKDLSGADLTGMIFDGCTMRFTKLAKASLVFSSFKKVKCEFVSFADTGLLQSDFSSAEFQCCDFNGTKFMRVNFREAHFVDCLFRSMRFDSCDMRDSQFKLCDFTSSIWKRCQWGRVTFPKTTLTDMMFYDERSLNVPWYVAVQDDEDYRSLWAAKTADGFSMFIPVGDGEVTRSTSLTDMYNTALDMIDDALHIDEITPRRGEELRGFCQMAKARLEADIIENDNTKPIEPVVDGERVYSFNILDMTKSLLMMTLRYYDRSVVENPENRFVYYDETVYLVDGDGRTAHRGEMKLDNGWHVIPTDESNGFAFRKNVGDGHTYTVGRYSIKPNEKEQPT